MSEATLQAIRDTLREKFRGMQILDYLSGKSGHAFRIERGGQLVHYLFVARELLDAQRQRALSTIFDRFEIVKVLEEAGAREVSVNSRGATVQSIESAPAPVAPAPRRQPRIVFPIAPPAPAPAAAPLAAAAPTPDAETQDPAPVVPPEPAPTPAPPAAETPEPAPTVAPPDAETEVAAPVVPPAPAPSDSFAAALGLIRELRRSLEGIDAGLGQSVRDIDADLAQAEASVMDAEARFQRATAQLTELVEAMDTVVTRARAGLDRVQRRQGSR